jgi:4-amino-4-deoxy-L-arabinose transferase-like glycosyltransferase
LGMLAIGVNGATAFIFAALSAGAIFLFVRLYGGERFSRPRRRQSTNSRAGIR